MRAFLRILAGLSFALTLSGAAAARPFVVILADARGTVATDVLAPYAILAESGAVDVQVVAATTQPVRLTPGYAWLEPQATLDRLPRRPDVVIVPALEVVDDPARAAWLREQVRQGVRVMSICNGAKALAATGLLDGRQATIHWYSQKRVAKAYPKVRWRSDARWIVDGPVTTTAGISAGEPATLALLGRLAGDEVMRATAARLKQPLPDPRHNGGDYHLTLTGMGTVVANRAAFWNHEDVALPLTPGFDEIAFGTALDAWSRTYRSTAWAAGPTKVVSAHGLTIYRAATPPAQFDRTVRLSPPDVMVGTFRQVARAYGPATARFVALQFEHPWGAITARP